MTIKVEGFHKNKPQEENGPNKLLFLKKGVTQVRVLPAYSEKGQFFRELKEIGMRINGQFKSIVSPYTVGDPCPFVQEGQRLYNLGGQDNVDLAKKFRPRSSFLFNVVLQAHPDMDVNIQDCIKIMKCGVKVKRQILDLDQDFPGGWGDITNLEAGFNLRITRTGQGRMDTEYTVKAIPQKTSIISWLVDNGFEGQLDPHNLDNIFAPPSYEEMLGYFEEFKKSLEGPPSSPQMDIVSPLNKETDVSEMPTAPVSTSIEVPSLGE